MTNQIWLRENEQRRAPEHVLLFLIGYACLSIYQLDSQANVAAFRERSGGMSWLFKERLDHVPDVDLHAEQEVSFPRVQHANSYYDCVVIHDIDFIPMEERNSYDCLRTPDVDTWQMSSAIDKIY